MKILVIGSGGREHALAWKLRQSEGVQAVYCVPGNAGAAIDASCIPGDILSLPGMANLAESLKVSFTVVGPEAPLAAGIVDEFAARGLAVVGPVRSAARLESSKIFAKEFMRQQRIPTADFAVVEKPADVDDHIGRFGFPVALKADGLAAGKGVVLAKNETEARATATTMLAGEVVGPAGRRLVVEQFLRGEEISFIVLTDGRDFCILPPTQDHKAVFDNDEGPNTGGMGAYCDPDILTDEIRETVISRVVEPTLEGVRATGQPFQGFLYVGLMLTDDGPMVLEFNVRLGDPETQPLLHGMTGNLAQLLASAAEGRLDAGAVEWKAGKTTCVVLTSEGYPGSYPKGRIITGIDRAEALGAKVFHAGTRFHQGQIATAGGRVLGVTAGGDTLAESIENAHAAVKEIHFEGMHFRRDIGKKGLKRVNQ